MSRRVGIIGGGILGLALGRHLLRVGFGEVTVLEKEARLASHQTTHNSGVVHAGLYYKPGSLKATLCRRGVDLLKEFCAEHSVTYDECGKLVVAVENREVEPLRAMFERAVANGVIGPRLIGREELRELEPHAEGLLAVHSPQTATVDFGAVARALAGDIERDGGRIRPSFRVTSIRQTGAIVDVRSPVEQIEFDCVVICAGLQADRVAKLAGDDDDPRIIPFRGEYYRLVPARASLVRGLIYPVPDPTLPFLGVHFTRRVDGSVDIGPNAVLALAREGYRRRDVNVRDIAEILAWPGFWKVAGKYWRTGLDEMIGSMSKAAFLGRARAYVPELASGDVVPAPAGVRAQAVSRQGALVDDFAVTRHGVVIALRNAPSPAATSSLAIAEYLYKVIAEGT